MKLTVLKPKLFLSALALTILIVTAQATVVSFTKDSDGITCTLDKGLMIKMTTNNLLYLTCNVVS